MLALAPTTSYLAPGQRYAPAGSPAWRADRQVTVLRVGRDRQGLLRVAYRCPDGHQVVEPTAQFEAAVASGQLVPVAGPGLLASC
jgi:hypothetical protein